MPKKVTQKNQVKVLYQNLNGVWYAFAETEDGIFFGQVPTQATASGTASNRDEKASALDAKAKNDTSPKDAA